MGWTSGDGSRKQVVAEYNKPETNSSGVKIEPLKHKAVRDEDWFLTRYTMPDGAVKTIIWVMIWEAGMHKEMDEMVHPFYYGCPVEWLDEAPETSAEWRKEVRSRNAVGPKNDFEPLFA
jgi:hypothetical protein